MHLVLLDFWCWVLLGSFVILMQNIWSFMMLMVSHDWTLNFNTLLYFVSAKPGFFLDKNRASLFEVDAKSGMLINTDNGTPMAQVKYGYDYQDLSTIIFTGLIDFFNILSHVSSFLKVGSTTIKLPEKIQNKDCRVFQVNTKLHLSQFILFNSYIIFFSWIHFFFWIKEVFTFFSGRKCWSSA